MTWPTWDGHNAVVTLVDRHGFVSRTFSVPDMFGTNPHLLNFYSQIIFDAAGHLWVLDVSNWGGLGSVLQLDTFGEMLAWYGALKDEDGWFASIWPGDLAMVTDRFNNLHVLNNGGIVQKFSPDGDFI